jgi:galactokinase
VSEPEGPFFESIAPGRINLIGEHIDYNDLSVLPMAVDRDMRIRFRPRADGVVRVSSPMAEFETREFSLVSPIQPAESGDWSNYVRAAAEGLLQAGCELDRGIDGEVRGTIPVAAGMSSSSALVVASANALLHANGIQMDPLELATLMAQAERYVGVAGGGMDQAASVNGKAGHALRIDFAPLGFEAIPMPSQWCWVVASSMVRAEKSSGSKEAYNERTTDCRDALQAVWQVARPDELDAVPTYRDLLGRTGVAGEPLPEDELLAHASRTLAPRLEKRFRHVVSECARVDRAQSALRADDPEAFGELMAHSHESLRVDYEVSISELDELVTLARKHGALGARLTGAGFGGCVIALCLPDKLDELMSSLTAGYYAPRGVGSAKGGVELSEVLFEVTASQGAHVIQAE